jgi:hypothetical protein
MGVRKFTDEQEQAICQRYLAGESGVQLGNAFGVTPATIGNILKRNGVTARTIGKAKRKLTDEQEREICRRYLAGENKTQLCKAFKVGNQRVINKVLKRKGIKSKSLREIRSGLTSADDAQIALRYKAGESSVNLSADFNVTPRTILLILRRLGIKIRQTRRPKNDPSAAQEVEISGRYKNGESMENLAAAFGVTSETVSKVLARNGVAARSHRESHGGLANQKERQACRRYLGGENTVQLGKAFGIAKETMRRILVRNGVQLRSRSEAKGGLPRVQEMDVCDRYQRGETTTQISVAFAVSRGCVISALARNDIETRKNDGYGDSIKHALDGTRHHAAPRECEFYLFELARYSATHCKPGISFNTDARVACGQGEYGAEVLRLVFATRAEAYFLEQAVLDATRGPGQCPEDLFDWVGATEVRAMPASDMLPIVLRLAAELEELGLWEFAARYVPMTAAQRATCQQRALQEVAA